MSEILTTKIKVKIFATIAVLLILALNSAGQDAAKVRELEITIGTFSTLSETQKYTVNPAISGSWGDYYFESRYNYEAGNSASLNLGKRVFRKLEHIELIPMVGLVFGSFKGATAELQTSLDYPKWLFSTDNQFSYAYTSPYESLFFNWTVAKYKLNNFFQIGLTSFLDIQGGQAIFDKGITGAVSYHNWAFRVYAFNYEIENRRYWFSLRYTMKMKVIRK
jgi:hypothetical protein